MKVLLAIFFICGFALLGHAQEARIAPSTFGIQTGPIGIWAHHESSMTPSIALRSEVGLSGGVSFSDYFDQTGVLFQPEFTLEPRWYYNLQKRADQLKRIDGNGGDFFSLKSTFRPDWFTVSNYENNGVVSSISIIPTWGIRRHIGKHFTFEAGAGIGYRYKMNVPAGLRHETALNLHLRLGYRF